MQAGGAIRYEGVHCELSIECRGSVVVMCISGSDTGEFGEAPRAKLTECVTEAQGPVDFFIDAREVRAASIEVSGAWAAWLAAYRSRLRSVHMLVGSRFVQMTADFVRRYADLQAIMRVYTDDIEFDQTLAASRK